MDSLSWLADRANSPATRIVSGIVSLGVVGGLISGLTPKSLTLYLLSFLIFHLLNQLYFAVDELKIPVCHRCGKILHPTTVKKYPKHTCKKNNNTRRN